MNGGREKRLGTLDLRYTSLEILSGVWFLGTFCGILSWNSTILLWLSVTSSSCHIVITVLTCKICIPERVKYYKDIHWDL